MNLNYHIQEGSIKCPYCDDEYFDDEYAISQNLGERLEVECDNCGKKFWAEASIAFSTYGDCKLNDENHILELTHIDDFFQCKNCPTYHNLGEKIENERRISNGKSNRIKIRSAG